MTAGPMERNLSPSTGDWAVAMDGLMAGARRSAAIRTGSRLRTIVIRVGGIP